MTRKEFEQVVTAFSCRKIDKRIDIFVTELINTLDALEVCTRDDLECDGCPCNIDYIDYYLYLIDYLLGKKHNETT